MRKIFSLYKGKATYVALSLAALVLASCGKDYLNTNPTNQVATKDAFSTTANAWAAVNGIHRYMYSQFYSQQDQGGQSANMMYNDVMGEDLVMPSAGNGWLNNNYKWISHRIATNSAPYYNYLFYYTIIANANMIIANTDAASGADADKLAIKGEAYAYRGWAYFQMIQLFGVRFDAKGTNDGLGLPIKTKPNSPVVARNTVADVYKQINDDLNTAMVLLKDFKRPNASHLNINVTQGIKARVALTQQNWDSAAYYAKLSRTGFNLMTNAQYTAGFNDYTNPEWIWGVHQQADQTTYFYSFFAYMSCNFGSSNIKTCPKAIFAPLYAKITDTDIRKKLWDSTGKNTSIPAAGTRYPYMNCKFIVADAGSSVADLPIMRVAEMYLIEAEALARNNKFTEAAAALYPLAHQRDAAYVQSVKTGDALVDEIMTQRRVELWGEGFRFTDLKRLNAPLNRNGGNHNASFTGGIMDVPAGDLRWQYVIPQDEINNTNGVVVQNPLN
ncbi:RagB/SusD family nutrient uptake outer membrane protein [Chitinophaga sp. Cy-1792]|uniref:RagB/SusD family nutrient uptake outer membrane protein n=1 Tax=Chitinophaga sp. Cy-1792 TaxID=2608339 RepID=UPI001423A16B|nr:RagB/SusD family nutrient uptake outer membrane protein [Chitinophaga sp. Cy-1792]NIG52528.1 RagB/SusD family nutrient uptake outer membrane protein [Chitinophaga sp. Cy-1792]